MKTHLKILFLTLALILMGACASIGRPEGGPKDETPPVFVRANPHAGSVNVSPQRLDIFFDENVKVEDVVNKLVVSPVQKQLPNVSANGRRVSVNFRDTLLPDVTYTIDFADAIRDLNEGNVLDGFAIDFSTGPTRDSLVIAGKLFQASNLEPAQGMIVGVHSNLSDTAISTLPFDRIAKTNQTGEFVIRNLAPGSYRLFALNDVNRNYMWDRSEDVAFFDSIITPRVENIVVSDTLLSTAGTDSIATRAGVRYYPNDILLTWFNENYKSQYMSTYTRTDSTRIYIEMGAPADSLPTLTIIGGEADGNTIADRSMLHRSALNDTLEYWLTDPKLIAQDTITVAARYRRTIDNTLSWSTDTLRFINKSKPKAQKSDKKKADTDSVAKPTMQFLGIDVTSRAQQELNLPLYLTVTQPIGNIDSTGVRIQMHTDTTWHDTPGPTLALDSLNNLLRYRIERQWIPETKYRLVVDSAAVTGIYGLHNRQLTHEFTTKSPDDYSTLIFQIAHSNDTTPVVVQLLDRNDSPVASAKAVAATATFTFVDPGTYYARAYIDRNDNGLWDTGSVDNKIQPEDVYYYPKKINIKKNWDVTQSWNLDELPIDSQKPLEITKNKPKLKAGEQMPTTDDEEDDDSNIDPFTGKPYNSDAYGRGGSTPTPRLR